jgi:hypothetical protein
LDARPSQSAPGGRGARSRHGLGELLQCFR